MICGVRPSISTPLIETPSGERSIVEPKIATKNANVSEILSVKNGFGFIKNPPNNLFFHYSSVLDTDFNDLKDGDKVEFTLTKKEDGQEIATNVRVVR